ncbi:MAG TPA: MoaD/ThiS family protein [Firmicutes bacterium]|nr:MoaD/ThiS family protein [Bacillota bacterium]
MEIKLFPMATLKKYFGTGYLYEVEEGTTVKDLLDLYDVPIKMIMFIMINKQNENLDYKLNNNDEVVIYPFISGG